MIQRLTHFYNGIVSLLNHFQSLFLLSVRLYWGWQFFITGRGKLQDIPRIVGFFTDLNIPYPLFNAYFVGSLECFGGLLLLVGLGSRLIALPLAINMIVAYLTAHRDSVLTIFQDSDKFVTQGPFLFLMASFIVLFFGPGLFSLDKLICSLCSKKQPTT